MKCDSKVMVINFFWLLLFIVIVIYIKISLVSICNQLQFPLFFVIIVLYLMAELTFAFVLQSHRMVWTNLLNLKVGKWDVCWNWSIEISLQVFLQSSKKFLSVRSKAKRVRPITLPITLSSTPIILFLLTAFFFLFHYNSLSRPYRLRIFQNSDVEKTHFSFPIIELGERIILKVNIYLTQPAKRFKDMEIRDDVIGDIEILQGFEWHEIVESTLQAIIGKIQVCKTGQDRKVLQLPQITMSDGEKFDTRIGLQHLLRFNWNELDVEGGDSDGLCLSIVVLLPKQLLYYLCII